jgi:hypothetical protein
MVTKFQSLTFLKAMLSILFICCDKTPYILNLLNFLSLKFHVQQKRGWDPAIFVNKNNRARIYRPSFHENKPKTLVFT